MKDMNEFRRTVYEKAGKKAAEEKVRKLRLKKLVTFAACFAVVIAPMLVALGTASKNKNENILFGPDSTFFADGTATTDTPTYDNAGGTTDYTSGESGTPEKGETSAKYTTTRPYFPTESSTETMATIVTTTPLFTKAETVQTSASRTPDTTMSQQTETAGAESGERADVTVGGKSVILKKGMSYAEICKLLGGEGRVALGAPIYTWSCGDGVTLTVRFELTGDADTPYPERMKAVCFTVIR